MKITAGPIWSKTDKKSLLAPCLQYSYEYWRQGQYRKERVVRKASLVNKDGTFLSGFIPRIRTYCTCENIPFQISLSNPVSFPIPSYTDFTEAILPKIKLRNDQISLIRKALYRCRGIIKAPTGIGKTILALATMKCLPFDFNMLFLCNEISLLHQTVSEMKKFGFSPIAVIGDGSRGVFEKYTVATIQSFSRIIRGSRGFSHINFFNAVFVDEADLGMGLDSMYYKVLTQINAPIRIGLSATIPEKELPKLVMEGLLGPIIGELTYEEAIEKELLAKPKIKIIKVPYSHEVRELRRYADVYEQGIVQRKARNELIIKTAKEFISQGKTVLILVTRIEHGENLAAISSELGLSFPFIQGNMESKDRIANKELLLDRKIPCVIADNVWKRGINIPSLDAIINAAGEKSEVSTLQRIGRGFRKTPNKSEFTIVDIFDDSHNYLIAHFGHRFSLYCSEGWV